VQAHIAVPPINVKGLSVDVGSKEQADSRLHPTEVALSSYPEEVTEQLKLLQLSLRVKER